MNLAVSRTGALLLIALLQSCGGGGGGGGDSNSRFRVSYSATSAVASATPGESAPFREITLTLNAPTSEGLYVEMSHSENGIDDLAFNSANVTIGILSIYFRSPGSMQNGTYTDTIQVRVCREQSCVTQIAGSPATITTSYTVSGTGTSAISLDRDSIQVAATADDQAARIETVRLTLSAPAPSFIHVQANHSSNAIRQITSRSVTNISIDVDIAFAPGQDVGVGTYDDTITLRACYHLTCVREAQGSPFTISTSLVVGPGAVPGVPPLDVLSRVALPHDVVDAEFSKALNQIVMVGSYPSNALYVYDVATATERQLPLNRRPTAVSVAPDGLTAAVGHDALITVVDLATVGQPGAPTPTFLDVSIVVFDVILDGNGRVHALPGGSQFGRIHTVDIATNTESLSTGIPMSGRSRGRVHPSGDYIYAADNGLSPDDIEKWDVRQAVAAYLYDSPYHGDYRMCGNLWISEAGSTIYTACGNAFRASTVQAEDMVHAGQMELEVLNTIPNLIVSVSESAALGEIALLEYDRARCDFFQSLGPCYHYLAYYESGSLNRLARHTLGQLAIGGVPYTQHGLFLFHDAVGASKYLLSRLDGMPDPAAEYYLSVVP